MCISKKKSLKHTHYHYKLYTFAILVVATIVNYKILLYGQTNSYEHLTDSYFLKVKYMMITLHIYGHMTIYTNG